MKDPSDELLDALYTALNGNVTYSGSAVPVYTRVVSWEDLTVERYIRVGEVRMDEDGPKDANITKGTVDIFVDTFFTGKDEGSKVPMNAISNSSTQLIDQIFTLVNFTQVLGRVESLEDFDYKLDPQGAVFRKLITYSFIIEEN